MLALRASSLPLLTKCPGALSLPTEQSDSEAAQAGSDWGTMAHHWKETGEVRGPSRRLENAFRKALVRAGLDTGAARNGLWPAGGEHETSVALRVDGLREVYRNDGHKYDGLDAWVTGTSDYYWRLVDGSLWVDDFKTGKFYPNPAPDSWSHNPEFPVGENLYPQDPESAQLRCYALGLTELLSFSGDIILSITHWPRLPLVRRHSYPERLWAYTDSARLRDYWYSLEQLYRDKVHNNAVLSGRSVDYWYQGLRLNPGDHCRFCPARTNCLVAKDFL